MCIAAGILSGALVAVNSSWVSNAIRTKIQNEIQAATGYPLNMARLQTSIFPPALEVHEITVFRAHEPGPWVTLHRARFSVHPRWNPKTGLLKYVLEVDGLRGKFIETDTAAFKGTEGSGSTPLAIDEIHVVNTSIEYQTSEFFVAAHNLEIHATPRPWEGYEATIRVPSLHYKSANEELRVEANGAIGLTGELLSPEQIHLETFDIFLPGMTIQPSGTLTLGSSPALQMKVSGNAVLERLREKLTTLPKLHGVVHFDGSIQGPMADLQVSLSLGGQELSYDDFFLGQVQTQLSFDTRSLAIENFKMNRPDLGIIKAEGSLAFGHTLETDVEFHFEKVGLGRLIEILGQPSVWVDGDLGGSLAAKGTLNPPDIALASNLEIRNFKSLEGPYQNADSPVALDLSHGRLKGNAHADAEKISIKNLVISQGSSALTTNGALYYSTLQGMELHAVSSTFNLQDVSPIAGLPYRGSGPLTATIEGPYDDLVISGTTEFKGFGIDQFHLGQTQATIIFADNALQLPRVFIQRQPGTVEGSARLQFGNQPTFDGAFELKNTLATPLLNSLSALPEHAHRFEAAMSGHVTIRGELANPDVRAYMTTDKLFLDQVDFGMTTVNLEMSPNDPWLSVSSRHQPESGSLELTLALNKNSPTQSSFHAVDVDMNIITPFLGDLDAHGRVSGQGRFQGELDSLNGEAALQVNDLITYDFNLGQANLRLNALSGKTKITGTCLSGAASIDSAVSLGESLPYTATMFLNQVNVAEIHAVPEDVDLWLTGSLFSQGDFSKPEEIIADSVFEHARLVWNESEFKQVRPVRINYANKVLEFSEAAFTMPALNVRLSGQVPLEGDLSLRLNLDGTLSAVPVFWSEVDAGHGKLEANILMEGTWERPIYAGHIQIENGSLRLGFLDQEIDEIQTKLRLSGRTIQIASGSARLGGGALRFGGAVILSQNGPTQTNLQADFSGVDLRPQADLSLSASGGLQLSGTSGNLDLRGDIELLSLHYTANIELDDLLRKKARPLPLPGFAPGEAWNLRVNIQGDDNLIFTNNFVESELSANLRITGTTQHMGLVGTVTPKWGRATYAGNTYKLEHGVIDFVEEYSINPRFEVQATTEACDMQLTVTVTGNEEGYSVQALGHNDNGGEIASQDALVCAQFGLRLDNDNNTLNTINSGDNTSSVLSGAVDAIWKVTGMDERVRRILPVVDQFTLTSGYSKTSRKTEPRILVTKELGNDWELKYNGPLYEKDEQHIVALEYRLNSRITLESTWVSVSEAIPSLGDLGLDLRLDWQFE